MAKKKINLETPELLAKHEEKILETWVEYIVSSPRVRSDLFGRGELKKKGKEFLSLFVQAISAENVTDTGAEEYRPIIEFLANFSRSTAIQGFTPAETALFIISLKYTLKDGVLQEEYGDRPEIFMRETGIMSRLIDDLGLETFNVFVAAKEEQIKEQLSVITEMEAPILQMGSGIILVPIIGIMDSARSQAVMDNMLQVIRATRIKVSILDITGVAVVDTAVSNHLLKISKATGLMGCQCIISGVSPDVAQSIVDLGIDISDLITKADMQDAVEHAFDARGYEITKKKGA